MLLAVDIGNTHVDLGVFSAGTLIGHRKLKSPDSRDPHTLERAVAAFLAAYRPDGRVEAAVLSSVAWSRSQTTTALSPLCLEACAWVDSSWDLGITVDYDDPAAVGIDRLLGAVAAFARRPAPGGIAVADAGTALTVDVVDTRGVFRGGLIMPGLHLALQALHTGTRLLPKVTLSDDVPLLGRSTSACMLAGAVHGTAAMVAELFVRLAAHLDQPLSCFLTGGDSAVLAPLVGPRVHLEPTLVLHGLALAATRRWESVP